MKKTKVDASAFLIILIVLLLAGGVIAAVYMLRTDPVDEALSADRVINMLFVIEEDQKPLSSYVLMYYPETKRAAVFDIPGNIGLIVKRLNRFDRIDSVYNSQSPQEFADEIENLLGIEISFQMIITAENSGRLVDLLDGVEIFIPSRVKFGEGGDLVLFPSGLTRLDGDKASLYAHYENPDEDEDAASFRRQRFFMALMRRVGQKNETLKNPAAARIYRSLLKTNMRERTRVRLFDEFAAIDTERVNVQAVRGTLTDVSGQMLLLPQYNGDLIKEIVRQTLGALTRQTSGALGERVFTVEVLNGTAINGLAGRTAELIRSFGYDVISTGNAGSSDYDQTVIYDRSGYAEEAEVFAGVIRCRNIQTETPAAADTEDTELTMQNLEYRADFTLIIGRNFDGRYVSGN